MTTALWFLAIQGIIGAFDTLYYHEWRARLTAGGSGTASELKLHAARDFLYAAIFGALPHVETRGFWAVVLAVILLAEIILTLVDFVVERRARKPMGDVYGGERVTHAVMGIIYGAMLANLLPVLWRWRQLPTALVPAAAPEALRLGLTAMAIGVFLSGLRDLYAALGMPHGAWPWNAKKVEEH
jgi:phosphatidylglycerophosphate synthase